MISERVNENLFWRKLVVKCVIFMLNSVVVVLFFQAWDDVERKEKPRLEAHEYKRASELNMEKSKLSLAEVYEQEYLKQADVSSLFHI